jgi:regulator of protease activity HflC (stomatin/prohibitin superfamily)
MRLPSRLPALPAPTTPWPLHRLPTGLARRVAVVSIVAMALTSAGLLAGARFARQDAGHVGVVRNGGPLDNRGIRQILPPGAKITWTGLFSQSAHEYPAARVVLFYTVTGDARRGDRREVDVMSVPTRDGVMVGLEATIFFRFVGERDITLLRRFDQTFGTRKFRVAGGTTMLYPWDGDDGFGATLDATFRPVLDNDLRTEIGRFACADLVASCTLVRRVVQREPVTAAERSRANSNIAAVEDRLSRSLGADLTATLGGDYFRDIHVRIGRVTLPATVQGAVDQVQAQYVAVNAAKARADQARFEAQRNRTLADSYNLSPALARIEEIRAAPKGSTIVLSGTAGGKEPGINVGGG